MGILTIYHNPRCSKSREGLELLKNSGKEFKIREYLKEPLKEEELKKLLDKLQIEPQMLIRVNEKIWKDNFKDKNFENPELIKIMVENPKLIERPIVEDDLLAVIGRPPSNIQYLLKDTL